MMYGCLCFSAGLLAIVNAVAIWRGKRGTSVALVLGGLASAYLFCAMIPVVVLNIILVSLAGFACWLSGARPRWVFVSTLGATFAAYGIVGLFIGIPEVREWEQLKAEYPMESLAGRLAYEHRSRPGANPATHDANRLDQFAIAIEKQAHQSDAYWRAASLEQVHAGAVEQFVNSPGFGAVRMLRPSPTQLHIANALDKLNGGADPLSPIPQRSRPYFSPDPEPGDVTAAKPDFVSKHTDNAVAFLNPFDFGYVRDRSHVAGFRPHRFRQEPSAPARWQVERLELVGLLKHDEPVVYLSENLPRMDELRDAETRPLDTFEKEALAALRRGEDLMEQGGPDRMRMLGSLRAAKQCVRCHDVERGELLGAFSYRLVREDMKD
jgi:hypothetical protein